MVTTREQMDEFEERHTDHYHAYEWEDNPSRGFSFPAYADGKVVENEMSEEARMNYNTCKAGWFTDFKGTVHKIIDKGHEKLIHTVYRCRCGSGLEEYWLVDCKNIVLCKVCNRCEEEKKSHYQPWVFTGYDESDTECPIEEPD